ncbi:MAG: hypothetical protein LBI11_06600 [Streptococcaceae bacterium]|jgi:hypothetical protein|nr:hypothetical protein [Streptococcaceae bacterium]
MARIDYPNWFARLAVTAVFALNVDCALNFIFRPAEFLTAYGLSGLEGMAAIQGLGVAFLMWNATYPAVIWQPRKNCTLFVILLIQQLIGLVGESFIALHTTGILQLSIFKFIFFDAADLILLSLAFAFLALAKPRKI